MTWAYRFKPGWLKPTITITGRDFDNLHQQVKMYFHQRNITFNDESLRRQILRQNGQKKEPKASGVTLGEVMKAATAMVRNLSGSNASNREIIRRSEICAGCPKKTMVSDCMQCGGARKVANFVNAIKARFGGRINVPSEIQKYYCSVCKCGLSLMVVTKYSDLNPESPEKINERPDHCWLKPSSPNFTQE